MEPETKFIQLFKRTAEYHKAVSRIFHDLTVSEDPLCMVSFPSVYLSIEHAIGAHALIALGMESSGYILYRPQFETLVRGMWLRYAADDSQLENLFAQMALDAETPPKSPISLAKMLKHLETSNAPKHVIKSLLEFRDITLKALNSFVHGGTYPMVMTITTYPPELSFNALLNSNALVGIASQLAVNLSDDKSRIDSVKDLHEEYSDCLHIIKAGFKQ